MSADRYWVVFRLLSFAEPLGVELKAEGRVIDRRMVVPERGPSDPSHFLPVFTSREAAIEWANGRESLVYEIQYADQQAEMSSP